MSINNARASSLSVIHNRSRLFVLKNNSREKDRREIAIYSLQVLVLPIKVPVGRITGAHGAALPRRQEPYSPALPQVVVNKISNSSRDQHVSVLTALSLRPNAGSNSGAAMLIVREQYWRGNGPSHPD